MVSNVIINIPCSSPADHSVSRGAVHAGVGACAGGYGGYLPAWPRTQDLCVDSRQDCITAPGFDHVLCVAWRQDNVGPPESLYEVR